MNSAAKQLLAGIPLGLLLLCGCGTGEPIDEIRVTDASLIVNAPDVPADKNDWPWWRGPGHNGLAVGAAPLVWNGSQNVRWKADVPGQGHGSPCVFGPHVFLATSDEGAQTQSLLCYDRETGTPRWTCQVHQGGFMHKHRDNTHASATPACDGKRVYCVFMVQDGVWASAVDFEGHIVWQKKVGDFVSMHGYGSSPALYKSLVIVQGDNSGGGFLAALHAETGEFAWKTRRANADNFGTPVVAHVAGRDQLLINGQSQVASYNPATGESLWTSEGPSEYAANTVAWNDELVFAAGGYPETAVMAIRADGSGQVVWRIDRMKAYVPSPLLLGDRLLVVQDNGVANLLDAASGEKLWGDGERLGGNFYASPVAAGDHVYVPDRDGMVHVFKAGAKFVSVSENFLANGGDASPAICDGQIFLRTTSRLYCIGEPG
jgi:hypothetical protein